MTRMTAGMLIYISRENSTPSVRIDQTAVEKMAEAFFKSCRPMALAASALAPKANNRPRQLMKVVTGSTKVKAETDSEPSNCAKTTASKVLANCATAAVSIDAITKFFRAFETR